MNNQIINSHLNGKNFRPKTTRRFNE